jgi:uncharacterized protein (TIGR03382 family)
MRGIVVAVVICTACTQGKNDRKGFDALGAAPVAPAPRLRSPLLRADVSQHLDERLRIPTFLQAVPRPAGPNLLATEAAREHLAAFAPLYGMTSDQAMAADLRALHDTGAGAIIARFGQSIGGVEVFRDELRVVMDRQQRVVALSGYLAREAGGAASNSFRRGAHEAVVAAVSELGAASTIRDLGPREGGYSAFALDGGTARAKRVLFHLPGSLEPAHYVEVNLDGSRGTRSTYQSFVFSATDGRMLFQHDLVFYDQFTYRVWAETTGLRQPFPGPQGRGGAPHPTGTLDGFQATLVPPVQVPLENAFAPGSPRAATDPWLPAGATETVGNNADAYVDLSAPDGLTAADFRASITAPGVFGHTYQTTLSPNANNEQRMGALQQLFYDVNFFHDWYYEAGFDEASGNAQQDNFGRGGNAADRLLAEGQDFSGRDNSNMTTPADGASPRMQMFIFNAHPVVDVVIAPPTDVAGTFEAAPAAFGPATFSTPGTLIGTDPAEACSAILNAADLTGHIALIDRGNCTFTAKVAAAQAAGALGVLIANNDAGLAGMGGTDATITIPSLMIRQDLGARLHQKAPGTVSLTLERNAGGVDRDGTIDNQIVAHEWGHMIQNRLIGDTNGLTNIIGRGMAEGWADFHALLMTVKAEDSAVASNANFNGVYAIAGYTSSGGANQGYYFGIRRVPYSTDLLKDPLKFRHIQDGEPPPTGPNGEPVPVAFWNSGNASTGGNSEVHNTGEVWATMLWECYAALLRETQRLSFDEARTRMRNYLVAAYKATPVLPTLLEARDALLSVALANDQLDYELFVRAFAKRGAGGEAAGPDRFSADNVGVVESGAGQNGDVQVVSVTVDDSTTALCSPADGALGAGEAGKLHVTLKSVGATALAGPTVTVTSSDPALTFPQSNIATGGAVAPLGTATVDIPVALAAGTTGLRQISIGVSVTDGSLPAPATATLVVPVNFQLAANQSATDDVEGPSTLWTTGREKDGFHIVRDTDLAHHWSSPDPGFQGARFLLSPPLQVGSGNFTISFRHRYTFFQGRLTNGTLVGIDAGVVEISTDGTNFVDAAPSYPGQVFAAGLGNPLEGRSAFTGVSPGYPNYATTILDAGTRFQGKTVQVRFFIGSADFVGVPAFGWDIDDIAFGGLANLPFSKQVGLRGTGCNRAPVAIARGPSTGTQRAAVTLDGSGSSDPDGDPIHARWVQASGPAATFDDATKMSPLVTLPRIRADSTLSFALFVDDGLLTSAPATVSLSAAGVNGKPVSNAGSDQKVAPSAQVQLDGSHSSDPDNDPLSYQWSQVSGTAVALSGATTANPSFTAPASGDVVLQLVVSDGLLASDPAPVTVHASSQGGGCGCTSNPDLGSIVPPLALFAFAFRRRRRR